MAAGLTLSSASLDGVGEVGQTLTLSYSAVTSDPPLQAAFEWFRDGVSIPGATSAAYVLVEADAETDITVTLTLTDDAARVETATRGPITVAALASTSTQTLSHHGASFTVTEVSETGTYADGSPWAVVLPSSTITEILPASTTAASRSLDNASTVTNTVVHGAMRNPGNTLESFPTSPATTLGERQAINSFGIHQGYDSYEGASGGELDYAALANID
ncbi:MAG: hypothetical protein AAFO98_00570, partial [Pseudomonadota bacterium]